MIADRLLLQRRVPAVQGCSARESAETLALFSNKVVRQLLRYFMGYDLKQKDRIFVEGTIMLVARLDAWIATRLRFLV